MATFISIIVHIVEAMSYVGSEVVAWRSIVVTLRQEVITTLFIIVSYIIHTYVTKSK